MASPLFTINSSAITSAVSVSATSTVTATLVSTTGVHSVAWTICATDDTGTPGDAGTYGAPSISGAVGETAQWTSTTAGTSAAIRCTINGGLGADGEPDVGMTTEGEFYVATAVTALQVCTSGEQEDANRYSSSTHGMIKPFNAVVRAHAAGGSGTDNHLVRWDGTGVHAMQDSGVTLDDTDSVSFSSNTVLPTVYQETDSADNAVADAFTFHAQDVDGGDPVSSPIGGPYVVRSGGDDSASATNVDSGDVEIYMGAIKGAGTRGDVFLGRASGGAAANRCGFIYADANGGIQHQIQGTPVLTVAAALITAAQPFVLPSYTVVGAPGAGNAGALIFVTDEAGGATVCFDDGANWRRVQDRVIMS